MSDKRSVHTDALDTLGTIIDDAQRRDAIHLAVEPVTAGTMLLPGQHVGIVGGVARPDGKLVGIVDPFLKRFVEPGQRFWLVVYPRQIRSLRHVWEHPDFPASGETAAPVTATVSTSDKVASELWLRRFIDSDMCSGTSYGELLAAAENGDEAYIYFGSETGHGGIPAEFWTHVEVVTGRAIPLDKRATHFGCAC